jgi:hypothetical protein
MKKLFSLKVFTLFFAFLLCAFNSNAQVEDDDHSPTRPINLEESLASPNGQYKLAVEQNNNVVFYKNNQKLWESAALGLRFDQTGNAKITGYDGNKRENSWIVKSGNLSGYLLKIEDSGNALIYNGTKAVWSLKNPNGGGYQSAVGYLLN